MSGSHAVNGQSYLNIVVLQISGKWYGPFELAVYLRVCKNHVWMNRAYVF